MTDSVHLLGSAGTLVGVLSKPDGQTRSSDVAVVIFNSGLLHRVGPFRLHVDLGRELAKQGIPTLRIDQSGKGDSERRKGLTFVDSMKSDFEDAAAFLEKSVGAKRFVTIGLCSGADDALFIAAEYPQVAGAALLEAFAFRTPKYYLRHFGPRLARLDLWALWAGRLARRLLAKLKRLIGGGASAGQPEDIGIIREFVGPDEIRRRYRAVVERKGRLLCVFTDGSRSYYNYVGQLVESLGWPAARESITEVHFPGAKHTYPRASDRMRLVEEVSAWATGTFGDERHAEDRQPTLARASGG